MISKAAKAVADYIKANITYRYRGTDKLGTGFYRFKVDFPHKGEPFAPHHFEKNIPINMVENGYCLESKTFTDELHQSLANFLEHIYNCEEKYSP